ncbi:DUF397 domain-containing protein [Streptomyces sp. t39]|uniref:DUF397 domain-containing protein n=1 Tax=Streptomyces sp. t39 TaxID=1828156 RepID=UPI0021C818F4|nr:DUF397 domain-containing protein [Streptomyces sp. t39]
MTPVWHKSSYSDGTGGNCLEVADTPAPHPVPVRRSARAGPRSRCRLRPRGRRTCWT